MRALFFTLALIAASPSAAGVAEWTGKWQKTTDGIRCEYSRAGQTHWARLDGNNGLFDCPRTMDFAPKLTHSRGFLLAEIARADEGRPLAVWYVGPIMLLVSAAVSILGGGFAAIGESGADHTFSLEMLGIGVAIGILGASLLGVVRSARHDEHLEDLEEELQALDKQ